MSFWKRLLQPNGREEPPIMVHEADLLRFLDAEFESSSSKYMKEAERREAMLDSDYAALHDSIDRFEANGARPSTDHPILDKFVMAQKATYAGKLKAAVVSSMNTREGRGYERYAAMAKTAEEMIRDMGHVNFKFRQAMYGYANQIDGVKRSFASFEADTGRLRELVEEWKPEYERYLEIAENISKLEILSSEAMRLGKTAEGGAPQTTGDDVDVNRASGIEDKIKSAERDAGRIAMEISSTEIRISGYTSPLKRAAKKFDHIAGRKRKLYDILNNPLTELREPHDFQELNSQLDLMEKIYLEGGIQNAGEVPEQIRAFKNADLRPLLERARELEKEGADAEQRYRSAVAEHSAMMERRGRVAKETDDRKELNERISVIEAEMGRLKSEICSGISAVYKKRINIA